MESDGQTDRQAAGHRLQLQEEGERDVLSDPVG